MRERAYFRASRLTTISTVLAAAIGLAISLLTNVSTESKVAVILFISISIVLLMFVERSLRESLYKKLERRLSSEIEEGGIARGDLEEKIRSESSLTSAEAERLRRVSPSELEGFTDELAENLRERREPWA